MDPVVTNESYEVFFDQEVESRTVILVVDDTVYITDFLQDSGDGWRPFLPLLLKENENTLELPLYLPAGSHVIDLSGDQFSGVAFRIQGNNLHNLRSVKLTNDLSSVTGQPDISGEEPTGAVNGSNKKFYTASNYIPRSVQLYLNGMRLKRTEDFNETGVNEITFVEAPGSGDRILVDYSIT